MVHDPGKGNLTPGIDWYAGFMVLLLLFMLLGCKHGDRYAYQQIKKAYDEPKKLPAVLSEPAVNHPGETPENVLKAAGALTLQTVIQIALQNNPVFFTATSMIGMIALGGITIRNSLVLIEFVNGAMKEGKSLKEAVLESGAIRLRPILLTAATTALGAWPITQDPIFPALREHLSSGSLPPHFLRRWLCRWFILHY